MGGDAYVRAANMTSYAVGGGLRENSLAKAETEQDASASRSASINQ
jgi:hypothetical protein